MSANLVLLENESQFNLLPFTLTRSAADIRIGILTIREKWERIAGSAVTVIKEPEDKSNLDPYSIPANLIPDTNAASSKDIFLSSTRFITR